MTLKQLEYFKAVAELLHFTKAADKLYISQPSLSYGIAQLETFLGVPLLKKDGKRVALTEYGEKFYKTTQDVLLCLEHGVDELNAMRKNVKNELALGYMLTLSSTFIPELIASYEKQKKDTIQFRFVTYPPPKLLKNIMSGSIDIMFSVARHESLHSLQISTQQIVLVAHKNHPLAQKESIVFEDIDNMPLIMRSSRTQLYESVHAAYKSRHMQFNIIEEAQDYYSIINYVILGRGISFIPRNVIENHHDLAIIPIKNMDFSRPIYMSWGDSVNENKYFKEFVDFIKENFSKTTL